MLCKLNKLIRKLKVFSLKMLGNFKFNAFMKMRIYLKECVNKIGNQFNENKTFTQKLKWDPLLARIVFVCKTLTVAGPVV